MASGCFYSLQRGKKSMEGGDTGSREVFVLETRLYIFANSITMSQYVPWRESIVLLASPNHTIDADHLVLVHYRTRKKTINFALGALDRFFRLSAHQVAVRDARSVINFIVSKNTTKYTIKWP